MVTTNSVIWVNLYNDQRKSVLILKLHAYTCNTGVCHCVTYVVTELRRVTCGPSEAIWRRWTLSSLVQIMACRLFDAKPLLEPMVTCCHLGPWKLKYFYQENGFESIVRKISVILYRYQCVNGRHGHAPCKDSSPIPARISNHMPSKVWDEITYPCPNSNGTTVKFVGG